MDFNIIGLDLKDLDFLDLDFLELSRFYALLTADRKVHTKNRDYTVYFLVNSRGI